LKIFNKKIAFVLKGLKDLEDEGNKGFEFEGASGGKKNPINLGFSNQ